MADVEPTDDFEARVAAAGRVLGAFGEVGEDEARCVGDAVRARLAPARGPRLALALGGLGAVAGLALLAWLGPWCGPARTPLDVDTTTLALLDEVEGIAHPGLGRAAAEEPGYEDQLAGLPDWLIQGVTEEPGAEEYPGAYGWLDEVL